MKILALTGSIILLAQCSNGTRDELRPPDARAERVNAQTNARAVSDEQQVQLAVEVELTATGVTPVNAVIVRAPQKTSSGIPDLRVTIDGALSESYSLADPRLAHVDREGDRILPSARTFIFAPLSATLTTARIEPVEPQREAVSRGGVVDLRPLLTRACENAREIAECQVILRNRTP